MKPYPVGDHPDGLRAALCVREEDRCAFCEEPLTHRRGPQNRITCGGKPCLNAYRRAWKRDWWQAFRRGQTFSSKSLAGIWK